MKIVVCCTGLIKSEYKAIREVKWNMNALLFVFDITVSTHLGDEDITSPFDFIVTGDIEPAKIVPSSLSRIYCKIRWSVP